MKKSYFQKTIEKLESEKDENIQKLSKLSFEKLNEMKSDFYTLHSNAKEAGYKEAAEVHFLKYMIVCQTITIKQGNEEQVCDYLT